jgi:hypothetical protein
MFSYNLPTANHSLRTLYCSSLLVEGQALQGMLAEQVIPWVQQSDWTNKSDWDYKSDWRGTVRLSRTVRMGSKS